MNTITERYIYKHQVKCLQIMLMEDTGIDLLDSGGVSSTVGWQK